MPGPIKPKDVAKLRKHIIPEEVFEAFNEMIAASWDGRSAVVFQNEVAALACEKLVRRNPDFTESDLYARGWLDIEDLYRKAGWSVSYDKPGYNEDYEASFRFTKK